MSGTGNVFGTGPAVHQSSSHFLVVSMPNFAISFAPIRRATVKVFVVDAVVVIVVVIVVDDDFLWNLSRLLLMLRMLLGKISVFTWEDERRQKWIMSVQFK